MFTITSFNHPVNFNMITLNMLIPLLKDAKSVHIDWNDFLEDFDPSDALDVAVYGSYVVDRILSLGDGRYEVKVLDNTGKLVAM